MSKQHQTREAGQTVTRDRIARDLAALGLRPGDVVFFHSSLSSLGWVEGGPDAVIDAFLDVVGPEGLVAVPTHSYSYLHYHTTTAPFDPRETPSRTGKLPDTLWRRPDAFRSAHPTHSVAAIGQRARELVAGHDRTSTFGREGPHRRYVDWGAKLLFLGVGLHCNTTLHAIEDWLDLPYLQVERALVKGPDGQPRVIEVTKSPSGHRDFYRDGSRVERRLRRAGLIHHGRVGAARTLWLPSQEMVAEVVNGIHEEPDLLLCERANCDFCQRYRQPVIDHVRRRRPTL